MLWGFGLYGCCGHLSGIGFRLVNMWFRIRLRFFNFGRFASIK